MATYRELSDVPGGLRIEVEAAAEGAGASTSLAAVFDAVGAIAAQAAQRIGQIPAEQRPGELTVEFGIRALGGGDLAIGLDPEVANFRVTIGWRQDTVAPAVPAPPEFGL